MRFLLLSNSTNFAESYMQWCKHTIANFLTEGESRNIVFVPFAAASFTTNDYTKTVNNALAEVGLKVTNLDDSIDKVKALQEATAIFVGGGNTFHLLKKMYDFHLVEAIKKRVNNGAAYVGWSAGSNVAGSTICTTNDMPIVEPQSFKSLGLIEQQINPHYTNKTIPNHGGETRKQRLEEYLYVNRSNEVLCLPEATYLVSNGDGKVVYVGEKDGIRLKFENETALKQGESL